MLTTSNRTRTPSFNMPMEIYHLYILYCICICMYIFEYIYICVYMYIYMYIYICIYIYICTYIYIHMYMHMQMHMYMYMCACARVFVGGYVLLINWLNKSWWCTWRAISNIDSLEVAEATDCCIGYSWFVRCSHGPCCSIYFPILPQHITPRINGHCPTPRLGFRENPGEKFSLLEEFKPYGFR